MYSLFSKSVSFLTCMAVRFSLKFRIEKRRSPMRSIISALLKHETICAFGSEKYKQNNAFLERYFLYVLWRLLQVHS